MDLSTVLSGLVGAISLVLTFFLISTRKKVRTTERESNHFRTLCEERESSVKSLKIEAQNLQTTIDSLQMQIQDLIAQNASLETELQIEKRTIREKIELLQSAREELTNSFKIVAASVVENQSHQLHESTKRGVESLLTPLKEKIGEFQKKAESMYETEIRERHSLAVELSRLMELNTQLSSDATNLTKALKGETKIQGNWGEMILERILEVSGLEKGIHFTTQDARENSDGKRLIPDVVISLPENRKIVVDSKVSLVAYDHYCSSCEESERKEAAKRHVLSLKNHINSLSSKEYSLLYGNASPDFVILFVPIEPAFILAVSEDHTLWEEAWKKNILMVSPSTLLFVLRIIAQLWTQSKQSQNALEISKVGGELYDKLASFVADFESVEKSLHSLQKVVVTAKNRLCDGRGSAMDKALSLKKLGIVPKKEMPIQFIADFKCEERIE